MVDMAFIKGDCRTVLAITSGGSSIPQRVYEVDPSATHERPFAAQ